MDDDENAGRVVTALWDTINALDWDGLASLCSPELVVTYAHTGETFDAAEFVALNREYPGRAQATIEDLVSWQDRAVTRARVANGNDVFYVASFVRVTAGKLRELVEVWTGLENEVPADNRPS